MDLEWTRCSILSVVLVIGLLMEVVASDRTLKVEITVMNDVTNVSGMISNLKHRETDLQLRCAVGISNRILVLPSRLIEQGQSRIWTINLADQKNNNSIVCSLMTNGEFYSFSFCIDAEPKSAESKQDWLVSESGLRKSGTSNFSARWKVNAVNEHRITVDDVDPAVRTLTLLITVSNIMQGANADFTRVDMQCVAMAKEQKHSLGTVSIFAWHSHVWRLAQRDNNPDTIFCTFHWIDDFHQRYIMDSNLFDSKPRTSNPGIVKILSREYFVTKTGLAYGNQEVYVAEWTKAVTVEAP